MKKILVAVDGSEQSLHAARMALEIGAAAGASVTAAYVVAPVIIPGDVPFAISGAMVEANQASGREILQQAVKDLGDKVTPQQLDGPPAERLAELAETGGFDMVVVGSRGRNAVARLFLGSTADRLVHICRKPVLVVR